MIKIWGLYAESFPGQDFWCFASDSLALSGYSPPHRRTSPTDFEIWKRTL